MAVEAHIPVEDVVDAPGIPRWRRLGRTVEVPQEELAFVTETEIAKILKPEALNSGNVVDIYQRREKDFIARSTLEVTYRDAEGDQVREVVYVDSLQPPTVPRVCVTVDAVRAMHRAISVLTRKVDNLHMTLKTCREHYYKELFLLRHGRPPEEEHEVYWFDPKAYEDNVTKEMVRRRLYLKDSEISNILEEKDREINKLRNELSTAVPKTDKRGDMATLRQLVAELPLDQLFHILRMENSPREDAFYTFMSRCLHEHYGPDGAGAGGWHADHVMLHPLRLSGPPSPAHSAGGGPAAAEADGAGAEAEGSREGATDPSAGEGGSIDNLDPDIDVASVPEADLRRVLQETVQKAKELKAQLKAEGERKEQLEGMIEAQCDQLMDTMVKQLRAEEDKQDALSRLEQAPTSALGKRLSSRLALDGGAEEGSRKNGLVTMQKSAISILMKQSNDLRKKLLKAEEEIVRLKQQLGEALPNAEEADGLEITRAVSLALPRVMQRTGTSSSVRSLSSGRSTPTCKSPKSKSSRRRSMMSAVAEGDLSGPSSRSATPRSLSPYGRSASKGRSASSRGSVTSELARHVKKAVDRLVSGSPSRSPQRGTSAGGGARASASRRRREAAAAGDAALHRTSGNDPARVREKVRSDVGAVTDDDGDEDLGPPSARSPDAVEALQQESQRPAQEEEDGRRGAPQDSQDAEWDRPTPPPLRPLGTQSERMDAALVRADGDDDALEGEEREEAEVLEDGLDQAPAIAAASAGSTPSGAAEGGEEAEGGQKGGLLAPRLTIRTVIGSDPSTPAGLGEDAVDLAFSTPISEAEGQEFLRALEQGLIQLGAEEAALEKVRMRLKPDSTTVEIRGPAQAIAELCALGLEDLEVMGQHPLVSKHRLKAAELWTVVHPDGATVWKRPSKGSSPLGELAAGASVPAQLINNKWLALDTRSGFLLIDDEGTAILRKAASIEQQQHALAPTSADEGVDDAKPPASPSAGVLKDRLRNLLENVSGRSPPPSATTAAGRSGEDATEPEKSGARRSLSRSLSPKISRVVTRRGSGVRTRRRLAEGALRKEAPPSSQASASDAAWQALLQQSLGHLERPRSNNAVWEVNDDDAVLLWEVAQPGGSTVWKEASPEAAALGAKPPGSVVRGRRQGRQWLRLEDEPGYMQINNGSVLMRKCRAAGSWKIVRPTGASVFEEATAASVEIGQKPKGAVVQGRLVGSKWIALDGEEGFMQIDSREPLLRLEEPSRLWTVLPEEGAGVFAEMSTSSDRVGEEPCASVVAGRMVDGRWMALEDRTGYMLVTDDSGNEILQVQEEVKPEAWTVVHAEPCAVWSAASAPRRRIGEKAPNSTVSGVLFNERWVALDDEPGYMQLCSGEVLLERVNAGEEGDEEESDGDCFEDTTEATVAKLPNVERSVSARERRPVRARASLRRPATTGGGNRPLQGQRRAAGAEQQLVSGKSSGGANSGGARTGGASPAPSAGGGGRRLSRASSPAAAAQGGEAGVATWAEASTRGVSGGGGSPRRAAGGGTSPRSGGGGTSPRGASGGTSPPGAAAADRSRTAAPGSEASGQSAPSKAGALVKWQRREVEVQTSVQFKASVPAWYLPEPSELQAEDRPFASELRQALLLWCINFIGFEAPLLLVKTAAQDMVRSLAACEPDPKVQSPRTPPPRQAEASLSPPTSPTAPHSGRTSPSLRGGSPVPRNRGGSGAQSAEGQPVVIRHIEFGGLGAMQESPRRPGTTTHPPLRASGQRGGGRGSPARPSSSEAKDARAGVGGEAQNGAGREGRSGGAEGRGGVGTGLQQTGGSKVSDADASKVRHAEAGEVATSPDARGQQKTGQVFPGEPEAVAAAPATAARGRANPANHGPPGGRDGVTSASAKARPRSGRVLQEESPREAITAPPEVPREQGMKGSKLRQADVSRGGQSDTTAVTSPRWQEGAAPQPAPAPSPAASPLPALPGAAPKHTHALAHDRGPKRLRAARAADSTAVSAVNVDLSMGGTAASAMDTSAEAPSTLEASVAALTSLTRPVVKDVGTYIPASANTEGVFVGGVGPVLRKLAAPSGLLQDTSPRPGASLIGQGRWRSAVAAGGVSSRNSATILLRGGAEASSERRAEEGGYGAEALPAVRSPRSLSRNRQVDVTRLMRTPR